MIALRRRRRTRVRLGELARSPEPRALISVVVPCYNEEACVAALAAELRKVFEELPSYDFEAILVDNGSTDATWPLLLEERTRDDRFRLIRLLRNFTADGGITAGLAHARGDAAFIVYADLQDPPALLPRFIDKWREGYVNVFGIIRTRTDNPVRRFNAALFYWGMDWLTHGLFPRNVGDFRLVDRTVYRSVNSIPERNRVLRGLFAWTGGPSIGIPYERAPRVGGSSKSFTGYSIAFALRAIFGFSYLPITMLTGMGFVFACGAFIALLVFTLRFVFLGVPFDGFGTIVGLMLLLFGLAFTMLGVIGRYLSMVHDDSKGRPNFVAMDSRGFEDRRPAPCKRP